MGVLYTLEEILLIGFLMPQPLGFMHSFFVEPNLQRCS